MLVRHSSFFEMALAGNLPFIGRVGYVSREYWRLVACMLAADEFDLGFQCVSSWLGEGRS
jgi:hypothetical protein